MISITSSALGFKEPTLTLPSMPLQEPREACWWKCSLCSSSASNTWQVLTPSHLWCRKAELHMHLPSAAALFPLVKQALNVQGSPCSCFLLPTLPPHPKGKSACGKGTYATSLPHPLFLHNNWYKLFGF